MSDPVEGTRGSARWARPVSAVGLLAMLLGAIDPLEGSGVILVGTALVALGAGLGRSRFRYLLDGAFGLVTAGVAAMWALSAVGGVGAGTGRSSWWALAVVPYPIGWILGVVGAVSRLRERMS